MQPSTPSLAHESQITPTPEVLQDLLRRGVERIFAQAMEAEADHHVRRHATLLSDEGRRLVVRNGYLPHRDIECGVGVLRVRQPRVHDHRVAEDGTRIRFASRILPPYARRTDLIQCPGQDRFFEGLALGDLTEALVQVVGGDRDKLSEPVLEDLRGEWGQECAERRAKTHGAPAGPDRVPGRFWAAEVPIPDDAAPNHAAHRCALVLVGQVEQGDPELIDVTLGVAGDDQAWLDLLLDLRRRGLEVRPERVADDASAGFWQALRRVSLRSRVQQMAEGA